MTEPVITDERFEELDRLNPDALFETTADGRLLTKAFPDALRARFRRRSPLRIWMSYGVRLGWLVDPYAETVRIYRADGSETLLERPLELSGEAVCAGLRIDLGRVWESG